MERIKGSSDSVKKYKCPCDSYHRIYRKAENRSQVGVISSSGDDVPEHWWFFKCMDKATFRFVDPVIHFCSVYMNKMDEFAYMYAAKNWLTMKMYHDHPIKERHMKIIESTRTTVFFKNDSSTHGQHYLQSMIDYAELVENRIVIFKF